MAMKKAIFLVFMLLPLLSAAQTPLEKFLNTSFEPGQSVQAQPLFSAGSYVLVAAEGLETYVVDAGAGTAVEDRQLLQEILSADAKNRSSFASKLSLALGLDEAILSAKKDNEAKCVQYLGLDMHPCTERESCILSCFSVPQCVGGPLYSDGFLEAFMEWNVGRQKFDSLVLAYSDSQEMIVDGAAAIDQKISVLNELSSLSLNLSKNEIFLNRSDEGCGGGGVARCYEYCPKVDYSAARIASGKQNLAELKAALTSLQWQSLRAEGILNRSTENDYYLANRGRLYEEFRLDMQKQIRNLNVSAESLSKKVWDREVDSLIGSLSSYSSGVVADANAGLYRKALSKAATFQGKAKAISDRISSDSAQYELLEGEFGSIEKKISNGAWLLGNYTAEKYMGQLSGIKANATAPATLQEIAAAKEMADELKEAVDNDIAYKATEQGGGKAVQLPVDLPQIKGLPQSLPCPMAFALFALLAVLFARR